MTAAVFVPIPVLVAAEWLRGLEWLREYVDPADIGQKYRNKDAWGKTYAVTVSLVLARTNAFAPLRLPTIQIDVWGKSVSTSGGRKLPWNTCAAIAERIADETYSSTNPGVVTVGGPQIMAAQIGDISLTRAPSTVEKSETATLARASLDVQINYSPVYEEQL